MRWASSERRGRSSASVRPAPGRERRVNLTRAPELRSMHQPREGARHADAIRSARREPREIDRRSLIRTAIGSTLVHPRHGALTVTAHRTRVVGGVDTPMVALHSELHQLSLQVPVAQLSGLA